MTPNRTTLVVEAIGLGWALGMAFLTTVYFACYLCGLPVILCEAIALVVACVLVGATLACTQLRRPDASIQQWPSPSNVVCLAALAFTLLPIATMVWMAVRSPLAGWDGWSIWTFKAEAFAMGGLSPGYFRDPTTLHTHPDYPLNLPIAESLLLHLPASVALPLVTLLGPACFVALLCLVFAGLERVYGLETAAIGIAIIAGVPIFLYNAPGGGADVPLCLYTGGVAVYLLVWWTHGQVRDAILAVILAGGAAWTKKEGLAVMAVTLIVFVGYEMVRGRGWRRQSFSRLIVPFLAACAIPLPWLLFVHSAHPLPRDFDSVTLTTFLHHLDRLPRVAILTGQQMLTLSNWGVFWIILGIAIAVRSRRLSAPGWGLIALLTAQIGVYIGVFAFSDWQSYVAHAQGTLDRLLLQATPLAALALIACSRATKAQRLLDDRSGLVPDVRNQPEPASR